jgi:hypothetical protein
MSGRLTRTVPQSSSLVRRAQITAFCGTTDVAFGAKGRFFISDGYANARILEYTADGKKVREWGSAGAGPGQFHLPHSIVVDENDMLYVADRENGRIEKFDLDGKFWARFQTWENVFAQAEHEWDAMCGNATAE